AARAVAQRRSPSCARAERHERGWPRERPHRAASLPGPAHHGGGDRRLGEVDPAPPPRPLAQRARLPRPLHRVEFFASRPAGHEARQEEGPAHADYLQPPARGRLRRPPHLPDRPAAQGGHDRARRPLRLHRLQPRRGARRPSCMGARGLQLRAPAGPRALLPGADRGLARPPARRSGEAQVPRGRHGPRPGARAGAELPPLPEPRPRHLRSPGGGVRAARDRRDGRHPDPAEGGPAHGPGGAARLRAPAGGREGQWRAGLGAAGGGTAKASPELTVVTFSLLYAADFADRLEHQIIPALRAGFIVIADRYMYNAFARNTVMGADPHWTRQLFGCALMPDLVLYLEIDVDG